MSHERNNGIVTTIEDAIVKGDYAAVERVVNRSRWDMEETKPISPDPERIPSYIKPETVSRDFISGKTKP